MSPKEKQSREAAISYLMKEMGFTRQQSLASIKELEVFGLIKFNAKGDFMLREV